MRSVVPDPPRDEHGVYEKRLKPLALAQGRPLRALLDEWDARSACHEWSGATRDDANERAMADVVATEVVWATRS